MSVCSCGHASHDHDGGDGRCLAIARRLMPVVLHEPVQTGLLCDCAAFEARDTVSAEDRLWRCLELTGEDTSDGRFGGWQQRTVEAVEELRRAHDRTTEALDLIREIVSEPVEERVGYGQSLQSQYRRVEAQVARALR